MPLWLDPNNLQIQKKEQKKRNEENKKRREERKVGKQLWVRRLINT